MASPAASPDEAAISNDPVWSPDGQSIAYEAVRNGVRQLFTHLVGSSTPALAFESPDDPKWLDDWSADGQWLLFHRPQPSKLYAVKPGDPASLKLLFETTQSVDGAHFSPDGKWIAYQLTEGIAVRRLGGGVPGLRSTPARVA